MTVSRRIAPPPRPSPPFPGEREEPPLPLGRERAGVRVGLSLGYANPNNHQSPVTSYFSERGAGRALVDERYRVHGAAPAFYLRAADDTRRRPAAASNQHPGLREPDQSERRSVVEPRHQAYRFERSDERHAIGLRGDGAVR